MGRQSEEVGAEMEKVGGSLCPLCVLFCAGPRTSSCSSDIRLSVGLSEACWTALSFFQRLIHSFKKKEKNTQWSVVRRSKSILHLYKW